MEYQPTTNTLIITICSRNKTHGGIPEYRCNLSIFDKISPQKGDFLKAKRNELRKTLDEISWQEVPVSELRMNKSLVCGQDFGGSEQAEYLPAINRYSGRFYGETGLGEQGKQNLAKSGHHLLILSGLYGLVTPSEPIQLYSCPVELESLRVHRFWNEAHGLTKILADYIRNNNISLVLDLTARKLYRSLIDWEEITEYSTTKVFHCYNNQAAGDVALPEFGQFARNYLFQMDDKKMKAIAPDKSIETELGSFIFRTTPTPPLGWPRELIPEASSDDEEQTMAYLHNKIDTFETIVRSLIRRICTEHSIETIRGIDSFSRSEAEKRMADYLSKYPMLSKGELDVLDFVYIRDYKKIILENWTFFEPIFKNKGIFKRNTDIIIELRNPVRHVQKTPQSLRKIGEGSLMWFEETIGSVS